jgi:hypothetical protein
MYTALHYACKYNSVESAQILLNCKNIDLMLKSEENKLAIQYTENSKIKYTYSM